MSQRLIYRIIKSDQDKEYLLTPDMMYSTDVKTADPEGYTYFLPLTPSLRRVTIRRIFKQNSGRCGIGGRYKFLVQAGKVRIGCQSFSGGNLIGLKRFAGIL